MSAPESEFPYLVGDEFDGSPILAGRFVGQVLSVGGLVEVEGSTVRITYLPDSVHPTKEPVKKALDWDTIEQTAIASLLIESVPAPIKRGRPKVSSLSNLEGVK